MWQRGPVRPNLPIQGRAGIVLGAGFCAPQQGVPEASVASVLAPLGARDRNCPRAFRATSPGALFRLPSRTKSHSWLVPPYKIRLPPDVDTRAAAPRPTVSRLAHTRSAEGAFDLATAL